MANQPNILLVMTDQQRGDCLSIEGHPALLTPNIDDIGHQGVHFHRAYTTCPSCIPSRRTLLTGQHPSTNGVTGFISGVPITSVTLPQALREGGYQTQLIGRTMHQHPPTQRYGYDHQLLGSTYIDNDSYAGWLQETAPESGGIRGAGISFNGWTARPWHLDESKHPTNWVIEQSRRFFQHRDVTCPLFLTASFYAPHPPLIPPAFYLERYLRIPLPPPFIGDWTSPPEQFLIDSARVNLSGEALHSARAGYFGLINHIDDQLYWLLQEFIGMSVQEQREWLIVFTSDHGEMLGDHYYFRKCEPYEGSARIPLLIRGSAGFDIKAGQRIDSPVCLEDLMPTLLDAAALPCPENVDGRSLLPILRGESQAVRELLHGEHSPCYSREQAHHYLTDGRWKYIWHPISGVEQLFDLQTDAGECHNLASVPDARERLHHFRQCLVDQLTGRPEGFTDGITLRPVQYYPGTV